MPLLWLITQGREVLFGKKLQKLNKMYRRNLATKTKMRVNKTVQGESIEDKVERITQNREPIKDGAPIIYTDRKDGVMPDYNIRTDRFEVATETMGKVAKMHTASREERIKLREEAKNPKPKDPPKGGENAGGGEAG